MYTQLMMLHFWTCMRSVKTKSEIVGDRDCDYYACSLEMHGRFLDSSTNCLNSYIEKMHFDEAMNGF